MMYSNLQAEFMETKYNSHMQGYGTSVFGKIVINISKSINNNNEIFRRLYKIIWFDMPSFPLASKSGAHFTNNFFITIRGMCQILLRYDQL